MKNITNYIALGAIALGISGAAQAVPTLRLTAGATTVEVADGSVGDLTSDAGAVTYSGAVGSNWTINVSTGLTKPAFGSPQNPFMDLNSINLSQGAGSITLMFSETGFTQLGSAFAAIGGTAGSSIEYKTYWSATNALFAMDNLLTSQSFGAGAFSGSQSAGIVTGQPYSLTQVVTITHTGRDTSSFDAELSVPDSGSTIALLGAALATLGLISRRRKIAA